MPTSEPCMSPGKYNVLIALKTMDLFMEIGCGEWRRGVLTRMEGNGSGQQRAHEVNDVGICGIT